MAVTRESKKIVHFKTTMDIDFMNTDEKWSPPFMPHLTQEELSNMDQLESKIKDPNTAAIKERTIKLGGMAETAMFHGVGMWIMIAFIVVLIIACCFRR